MNIRLRLTLWYTAILLLILVVFSSIVYLGLTRSLMAALDNHLQREAAQVIGELRFEDVEDEAEEEHEEEGGHEEERSETSEGEYKTTQNGQRIELSYVPEEGVFWRVFGETGHPLFDPGHFQSASAEMDLDLNRVHFDYATLADGTPIRLYTAPFVIEPTESGIIQVAESYSHIQEVQNQLLFLLAISIPFVILVTSVGGWFLATRALAPIDRITRSAQHISAADLHQRLDLDLPNDEVGRLAATFDAMLARLEDAFERQKRFIADASHEMRTPLTILKGDVEVALNRPRSATEYQETLQMVNQTADRLTALVEELFLLARADNQQYPLRAEPLDLARLLQQQVSHLRGRAEAKQISLRLDTPSDLPLTGDPDKLTRLFLNLIDNAIKYSHAGDVVTVSAEPQNGHIRVGVADTGPGIPPEHLAHLFERFYRVDKARSRQGAQVNGSSGAGLGLSIAQWLAQVHGGTIAVDSKIGQGTTFTVWLPTTPDTARS